VFSAPQTRHIDALFADARGKPGEIAVGRHEAETVETTTMKQVHRVDHQRYVGSVLAGGVSELLLRDDGMFGQNIGPALCAGAGEVPVNAADTCLPDLRDLLEQPIGDFCGRVIGVDKDRKAR
jgi:hypothetical protein